MLIPPNRKGEERHNEVGGREAGKPGRWGQCHPVPVVVTMSRHYQHCDEPVVGAWKERRPESSAETVAASLSVVGKGGQNHFCRHITLGGPSDFIESRDLPGDKKMMMLSSSHTSKQEVPAFQMKSAMLSLPLSFCTSAAPQGSHCVKIPPHTQQEADHPIFRSVNVYTSRLEHFF